VEGRGGQQSKALPARLEESSGPLALPASPPLSMKPPLQHATPILGQETLASRREQFKDRAFAPAAPVPAPQARRCSLGRPHVGRGGPAAQWGGRQPCHGAGWPPLGEPPNTRERWAALLLGLRSWRPAVQSGCAVCLLAEWRWAAVPGGGRRQRRRCNLHTQAPAAC
jgi:hypothetical protein